MVNLLNLFDENKPTIGGSRALSSQQVRHEAQLAMTKVDESVQNEQISMDGPSNFAGSGGWSGMAPQAADDKFKLPKIPKIFRNAIWPCLIAVMFLNNKIQKQGLEGQQQIEEFKITALTGNQMAKSDVFVAAVQEVSYNMVTQERDTAYYMMANPDRVSKTLGQHNYGQTARLMEGVNNALGTVGKSSETLGRVASEYITPNNNGTLPLSDMVMDELKFKHYQVIGVQELNNASKVKDYYQGRKVGDWREDYVIKKENAFTKALFPTGNVTFHLSALFGNQNAFKSVNAQHKGDDKHGVDVVDGKKVQWFDALEQFQENTDLVALYPISSKEYAEVVAHKKTPNLKR